MAEKKILIAEDDVIPGKRLKEFLTSEGYSVDLAINGKEAIEMYNQRPAQVVITDIGMPVMDGNELIGHLNTHEIPPVIFVTTGQKAPELIIEIMKKGVYDYILKPVDLNEILLKITRAFEAYELKRAFEITQREKVIRLENALEWYRFEEKLKSRDVKSLGTNIFESLLTSFSQGRGFGSLVTLMSIMKSIAVKDDGFYKIQDDLFRAIMDNLTSAEKALQTFSDIAKIATGEHVSEKISLSLLYDYTSNKIKELSPEIEIKKHHVVLSDKKNFFDNLNVIINRDYFNKAIEEILLNAMKFSPAGSEIMILFRKQNDVCIISVINDITANDKGHVGIPLGYENLVFEPFFRLTKTVNDQYNTLDYGLGLTLTQKIITGYKGTITINNITDYSDISSGGKLKVECSVNFPVINEISG